MSPLTLFVLQAVRIAALQCMHALTRLPTSVVSPVLQADLTHEHWHTWLNTFLLSCEISHQLSVVRQELHTWYT